jgi:ssDNA-binding Zn-finger/Zn-ribbon topoisomerase 1
VEGRCYRVYRDCGYIVRVLDERKTVFGTAFYQMNHATLRVGLKRFHVVTWFGVCGYNNFKSEGVKGGVVPCPACGEEMVRSVHVGKRRIVKDLGDAGYKSVFADEEFDESGKPNFVDVVGSREDGGW